MGAGMLAERIDIILACRLIGSIILRAGAPRLYSARGVKIMPSLSASE